MINTVDYIKDEIQKLYKNDPNIHITVKISHPKLSVSNSPAVIKGVYPNIFRIEENDSGYPKCHSLQYTDILTGQIKIAELSYELPTSATRKKNSKKQ